MAIIISKLSFFFPSVTGLQQIQVRPINFDRTVRSVAVALQGFDIRYDNGDHHVLEESIEVSGFVLPGGRAVDVSAVLLLRDGSGNIDDPYSGTIDLVVLTDVV